MAAWREPQDEPTPEQQAKMRYYVPTRAEIDAEKRKIREEKGETEPIPESPARWDVLRHLLACEVDEE